MKVQLGMDFWAEFPNSQRILCERHLNLECNLQKLSADNDIAKAILKQIFGNSGLMTASNLSEYQSMNTFYLITLLSGVQDSKNTIPVKNQIFRIVN